MQRYVDIYSKLNNEQNDKIFKHQIKNNDKR